MRGRVLRRGGVLGEALADAARFHLSLCNRRPRGWTDGSALKCAVTGTLNKWTAQTHQRTVFDSPTS